MQMYMARTRLDVTEIKRTGGDAFDPQAKYIHFLAATLDWLEIASCVHDYLLVAINILNGEQGIEYMRKWLASGKKILLDSGIFNLAMTHARKHGVSLAEALALAPEDIDGFDALFERYVALVREFSDQLWGYIELDQGGRENKIRTRQKLEKIGFRPIPVYHPLNDGWDYFDELAQSYDRICVGNLVDADTETRRQILLMIWLRHARYPNLWIHILGITPNELFNALPFESADSSAWLSVLSWGEHRVRVAGQLFGHLPDDFRYVIGSDPQSEAGRQKAILLSAWETSLQQRNWQQLLDDFQQAGGQLLAPETVSIRRKNR